MQSSAGILFIIELKKVYVISTDGQVGSGTPLNPEAHRGLHLSSAYSLHKQLSYPGWLCFSFSGLL